MGKRIMDNQNELDRERDMRNEGEDIVDPSDSGEELSRRIDALADAHQQLIQGLAGGTDPEAEGRGEEEGDAGKDQEDENLPSCPIPAAGTQYMVLQLNSALNPVWDWTRFHS